MLEPSHNLHMSLWVSILTKSIDPIHPLRKNGWFAPLCNGLANGSSRHFFSCVSSQRLLHQTKRAAAGTKSGTNFYFLCGVFIQTFPPWFLPLDNFLFNMKTWRVAEEENKCLHNCNQVPALLLFVGYYPISITASRAWLSQFKAVIKTIF